MRFKIRHLAVIFLPLFLLSSCGTRTQVPSQNPTSTRGSSLNAYQVWIADFKRDARAQGISESVLNDAFSGVTQPLPGVIERDHTQPEKTRSFEEYINSTLTDRKIDAAKDQWNSHREILAKVQKAYGVPAPTLLALWESESNFGKLQGNFSIVQSLATLAYDGRRSEFFRKELVNALIILQQEHMRSRDLTGSWAGAMGQVQFMPTSFLNFAVDFDGDGKKDIWHSDADALASMANYLHTRGWDPDTGWGMRVQLPRRGDFTGRITRKEKYTLAQWQKWGLRSADGTKLPQGDVLARLVMPDDSSDNVFLVYPNYDVIMDWNRSTYFATSVNLLADAIAQQ